MTGNIFEIFNPGDRHWREHKDLEKVQLVAGRRGGKGPISVDLDSGTFELRGDGAEEELPPRRAPKPSVGKAERERNKEQARKREADGQADSDQD